MWKYEVIAIAVVAGCCYNQPRFKQSPSMDALGVVFNDIVFGHIVGPCHNFPFTVTRPAQNGDVHFIGAGSRVAIVQDVVMTVALFAAWSIGVILQERLSVYTLYIV